MDAFLAKFSLPSFPISISPAVLTFPTQGVGIASPVINVTVANISSSSVAVTSAAASGDFAVASNGCGSELPAGDHCVIAVGFNPSIPGKRTGTFDDHRRAWRPAGAANRRRCIRSISCVLFCISDQYSLRSYQSTFSHHGYQHWKRNLAHLPGWPDERSDI